MKNKDTYRILIVNIQNVMHVCIWAFMHIMHIFILCEILRLNLNKNEFNCFLFVQIIDVVFQTILISENNRIVQNERLLYTWLYVICQKKM